MAGKRNTTLRVNTLKYIIDRVDDKSRVGVCLDTCHTYTAGYDIVNDYDKMCIRDRDQSVGQIQKRKN